MELRINPVKSLSGKVIRNSKEFRSYDFPEENHIKDNKFLINGNQGYKAKDYTIEGDYSLRL